MTRPVCVITGATGGIGSATARGLAELGHDLVLVGRDSHKLQALAQELREKMPQVQTSCFVADLSSVRETVAVGRRIREKLSRLDVLVNNAGAINERRTDTTEGLELTFALNHMSYFALTLELLELLKATANARVVSVASDLHRSGKIDFEDLGSVRSYSGLRAYKQSKLANVLFSSELARRLRGTGVTSNSLHPGVVATGFGHNNHGAIKWWVSLSRPFLKTPAEAAKTTLYVSSSPELAGVSGAYFKDGRQQPPSSLAQSEDLALKLWTVSEDLLKRSAPDDNRRVQLERSSSSATDRPGSAVPS